MKVSVQTRLAALGMAFALSAALAGCGATASTATAESAADLAMVGAEGVAVVSAIIKADWPREAASGIRSAVEEGRRLAALRDQAENMRQNP